MDRPGAIHHEDLCHGAGCAAGRCKKRIIADALNSALHLRDEAEDKCGCVRESNFEEMYRLSGDFAKQEALRQQTPNSTHCRFLMRSPGACDALPADIGSAKCGEPCPNNPFVREPALMQAMTEVRSLIDQAEYLYANTEMGFTDGLESITPAEYVAIRIMRSRERTKKQQSDYEFLSRLLTGGSDGS